MDSDGVSLQGIDTTNNDRIVTYGTKTSPVFTLPGSPSVATCGASLLAVVGVGRIQTTVQNKRLAIVFVGKPPIYLTPKTVAYLSPSALATASASRRCSIQTGGKLSGPGTLTTVIVKGGKASQPAPNTRLLDSSPEWGLSGDLVYARTPAASSTAQLWYASGGNPPHDTRVRASDTGQSALTWDWSITPPLGVG